MPACPQCNKPLRELVRRCPTCQADLDLLVDYVSHLSGGLERADNLAKAGEFGEAIWAYLEVLETDPDNGPARKQMGRVVTAVRKFDLSTPARRVAIGLPAHEPRGAWKWLPRNEVVLGAAVMFLAGVIVGLVVGFVVPRPSGASAPEPDAALLPATEPKAIEQLGPAK